MTIKLNKILFELHQLQFFSKIKRKHNLKMTPRPPELSDSDFESSDEEFMFSGDYDMVSQEKKKLF